MISAGSQVGSASTRTNRSGCSARALRTRPQTIEWWRPTTSPGAAATALRVTTASRVRSPAKWSRITASTLCALSYAASTVSASGSGPGTS